MFHETYTDQLLLVARVLFGGVLAFMALNHFMGYQALRGYAAMKKVPAPGLAILGSGTVLLAGALSVLLGAWPEAGAILITIFLVPVTFTMHSFWSDTDPTMKGQNMAHFLKNLVILGGAWAFAVLADGEWRWALNP